MAMTQFVNITQCCYGKNNSPMWKKGSHYLECM